MNRRPLICAALSISLAVAGLGQTAFAQAYPAKPITMVVPFPPGGVADTVGRPVAEAMSRHLKQSVVVENKGGAGGGIGMAQVAKAKGDGYTVLMSLSSLVVLPEAAKILQRAPMYETNQLKAVARFTADPTASASDRLATTARCMCPWNSSKPPPRPSCCMCPTRVLARPSCHCSAVKSKPCPPDLPV